MAFLWHPERRIAVLSAPSPAEQSSALGDLAATLAENGTWSYAILTSPERKWSDRELVRAIIDGLGGEPVGRTGLELIAEARSLFMEEARPIAILIDDAAFAGSQLEVLQSLLATNPTDGSAVAVKFVLAGPHNLADRIQRRRSLKPLVTSIDLNPPGEEPEVPVVVQTRLDLGFGDQPVPAGPRRRGGRSS